MIFQGIERNPGIMESRFMRSSMEGDRHRETGNDRDSNSARKCMQNQTQTVKIDLHCHSWASDRPSLWLMQRLGCPESFTAPEQVREFAMLRGMDFVTITDHNTTAGVKAIEHYPNVIIGDEITAYFPIMRSKSTLCAWA